MQGMQTLVKVVVFVVAMGAIWVFVQERQERNRQVLARNAEVERENARIEQEEAAEAQAASPRGRLETIAAQCKGRVSAFDQQGQVVTVSVESNTRDAFKCFLVETGISGLMVQLDKTYNVPFEETKDAQGAPLYRHSYRFTVR